MLCSFYPPSHAAGLSAVVYPQAQLISTWARFVRIDEVIPMQDGIAAALSQVIADPSRVLTAPAVLDRLSHDFYWYSPILRPLLVGKTGYVAVHPINVNAVLAVMRFAGAQGIPVTVRGAGTGNYGQCVPLHGGIVLDLSLMDKLEGITSDGVAVC